MTINCEWTVWCDSCDAYLSGRTRKVAIDEAVEDGWLVTPRTGQALCKNCRPEPTLGQAFQEAG